MVFIPTRTSLIKKNDGNQFYQERKEFRNCVKLLLFSEICDKVTIDKDIALKRYNFKKKSI